MLAEQIVAHLERCRFRLSQERQATAHTPDMHSAGTGRPSER
jgi:hypothetical protein